MIRLILTLLFFGMSPFFAGADLSTPGSANLKKEFKIYGFISYPKHMKDGVAVNGVVSSEDLAALGIRKVNLVYQKRIVDFPDKNEAEGIPNEENIKAIALETLKEPEVPVSLDVECWKRFDLKRTPSRFVEVIESFKSHNKLSQVGLYSTVPQNTYGWQDGLADKYDALNAAYAGVAEKVDYFSPSLYNYGHQDNETWAKFAAFIIEAAKKYSSDKKIIPYLSPEFFPNVKKGEKATRWLSYDDMMFRLKTLRRLGAAGCILWTGSGSRDDQGNLAVFDPKMDWVRAVVDFQKINR